MAFAAEKKNYNGLNQTKPVTLIKCFVILNLVMVIGAVVVCCSQAFGDGIGQPAACGGAMETCHSAFIRGQYLFFYDKRRVSS